MSVEPTGTPSPLPGPGEAGSRVGRPRRQSASVTLRAGAGAEPNIQDMMDPASRSLADALKITYRLLLVAMVAIAGVYLLSGFQKINEQERGVRTIFGRVTGSDLAPGFTPSFPEPFGELIRVPTGEVSVELRREFFPRLTETEEKNLAEKGASGVQGGTNSLDPDAEGSLITADGNLVHARVVVTYRRTSPSKTLMNIAGDPNAKPEESVERKIVAAAARRAMVHATARLTVDEFLSNQRDAARSGGDVRPLESLAREMAQATLDSMDTGIEIQQFLLNFRMPPRFLNADFNAVLSAQSDAAKAIAEAELAAKQTLNAAAGEAAPVLLSQIDQYERELGQNQPEQAAQTLDRLHKLMMREPVEIDGKTVTANTFGTVSTTIAAANRHRTEVVSRAQADAALFTAKRAAYTSNASVMVNTEWTGALQTFLQRPSVQTMLLPASTERVVMMLNRDPAIKRRQETDRMQREALEAQKKRDADRRREQFERQFDGTGRD